MNVPKNIRRPDPSKLFSLYGTMATICKWHVAMSCLVALYIALANLQELSDPSSGNFGTVIAAVLIVLACGEGGVIAYDHLMEKMGVARSQLVQREQAFQLREQQLRDDSRAA